QAAAAVARGAAAETRADDVPSLVIRDGDLMAQPPIAIPQIEQVVFLLDADEGALKRLCDHDLNLGRELSFAPLGPFVLFYAARLTTRGVPHGGVDEIALGFWVPLVRSPGERIEFYTPYLWVDSSWALAAGRELFGFPKHIGDLHFAPEEGSFSLS